MENPTLQGIETWLIREARLLGSPQAIVSGLCERLIASGIAVVRMRISQRVANPLFAAWGLLWQFGKIDFYKIDRSVLESDSYLGSPFEKVIDSRAPYRRRLDALTNDDHEVLHEMRALGGLDYLALPIEYGDGTIQVAAFVISDVLDEAQCRALADLRFAISAALEPTAMRGNTHSMLTTYLGEGPAERVLSGAIRRGDIVHIDAVVLFTDLCGFTALAETRPADDLLAILDRYFEAVVTAVRSNGGEVLKFLGDGVLAIFPITETNSEKEACAAGVQAVRMAGEALNAHGLGMDASPQSNCFAAALHIGPVVYGNVGSRERLDFTVVGPTVNLVSRLEELAKATPELIVCSAEFSKLWGGVSRSLGVRALKGFSTPREVHAIERARQSLSGA